MKQTKLPTTDSIEKLARFWDTHDLTDFEHDLEEVKEPVFQPHKGIEVRLEPRAAAAIQKLAQAKGVSQEKLVSDWILQCLAQGNGRRHQKRGPASKRRKTQRRS